MQPRARVRWTVRAVEWALVAVVLVALVAVFGQHVRAVRGQAEEAAVKSTLGALRATMALHQLRRQVTNSHGPGLEGVVDQRNPFELLQRRPSNYAGETSLNDAALVAPGTWVFDPVCVCIGYRPTYPQWLLSASGDSMLWFDVGSPGPLMITAREDHLWRDQLLK